MESVPLWLRDVAAVLGILAAVVTALGVIWGKALGPWVARPLSIAVRRELNEAVEAIILSDLIQGHIKEATEEAVVVELKTVTRVLADHAKRLERIEADTKYVAGRMAERPARGQG